MVGSRWAAKAALVVVGVLACADHGPLVPALASLRPDSLNMPQGLRRLVVPLDSDGGAIPADRVHFTSADSGIATVDSVGWVTASGHAGTTAILATTLEGDTAVAAVEVTVVLTGLAVEPESVFVRMGTGVNQRAWGLDSFGHTVDVSVRVESNDFSVASANDAGPASWSVVPHRPGKTVLTVTASDGWPLLQRRIPVEVAVDTSVLVHMPLPGKPWDVAVDGTGVAYVSLRDPGQVLRLDPDDYSIQAAISLPDEPVPIALNSAGTTLYAGVTGGKAIVVIDPVTMTERYRLAVPGSPVSFVLDEARGSLHVVTQSDGMFRMLLPGGEVVDSAATGGAAPIALDAVGGTVLVTTWSLPPPDSGDLLLAFDALDYSSRVVFKTGRYPGGVAATRMTRTAITGYWGGIDLFDLPTGVLRRVFIDDDVEICAPGLNGAESELYLPSNGKRILVLSYPQLVTLARVEFGGRMCRFAVDPRNGRLVVPNEGRWLDVVEPWWQ